MRKSKKTIRFIIAIALAMVLAVGQLAGAGVEKVLAASHGPKPNGYAYIKLIDDASHTYIAIFSEHEETSKVEGLSYNKATNTLTMNNFEGPRLDVNEMGDDFTIKLVGTNTITQLQAWGFGYSGSVKLTGSGTLNINNSNDCGIELLSEVSKSQLYIDKDVKLNISCGGNAIHVSDSTHSTPIAFASGVAASKGKIATVSSYKPEQCEFSSSYGCKKNGKNYGWFVNLGDTVFVHDEDLNMVDTIPLKGITVPAKAVEKAGYTVKYTKTKIYFSGIAEKKLSISKGKVSVAKASIKSLTGAKKAFTVKVNKVSGAKGYQLRYATNSKMSRAKTSNFTSTSKKISGLKAKTNYYVQVRAYKADSKGKKIYGAWSAAKKVKTK